MNENILRPMTSTERQAFEQQSMAEYAKDLVASGQAKTLEAGLKRAEAEFRSLMDEEGYGQRLCSIVDGEGQAVGFLWYTLMPEERVLYVSDIVVLEGFRGRGFGRRAMMALDEVAQGLRYDIALHVHTHNAVAYGLYASLGFRVEKEGGGSTYMRKCWEEDEG